MSYEYMCKKIEKDEEQIADLNKRCICFYGYKHLNDEEFKQLIILESKQIYQETKAQHLEN